MAGIDVVPAQLRLRVRGANAERAPSRDTYLGQVIRRVEADLRAAKIRASVIGRLKHYYSIYQKMVVLGRDFADIYDLVGIRVLVDSVRDCYAALGAIHAARNPAPSRFKDYVAMPKFNGYQSLHTTVIGPEGRPVEIQICTFAVHQREECRAIVERGDQTAGPETADGGRPDPDADVSWLRQQLDWQKETADAGEFLESLRFDLRSAEIYVFTPKGDMLALPAGSTPIDFAYAVHTEVGHRCTGARVNGSFGAARVDAAERRRRRDLYLQGPDGGPQSRLARLCQVTASTGQDSAVVREGAPRRRHWEGARVIRHRGADAADLGRR